MPIIGFANGTPVFDNAEDGEDEIETRAIVHDPHSGQFTSGGGSASPAHKAYAATLVNAEKRHKESLTKGKSEHRDPEKKGWYSTPETGAAFNKSAAAYKHTTTAHSKEEHAAAAKAHGHAESAHRELGAGKNSRHRAKHDREANDHAQLKSYHEGHSK